MNDKIYCKSGGCSAKLGAKKLSHILEKIDSYKDSNVLIGFDSRDDAAVYQIDENHALVYKTWKREGDKLIMDIESIGNGQTIASTDTMNVLKLDKDSLILDNGGMIMRYHRVRE